MGDGSIASRILESGTMWRWVDSFKPPPLFPRGKSPRYALGTRLARLQSFLEAVAERNSCFCWKPNPGRPAHSLFTIPTELSRLVVQ